MPKAFLPATSERAGARKCQLDAPSDITTSDSKTLGLLGMGTKIAFGPAGGIVVWAASDTQAGARPLGNDGRPTGPVKTFAVEGSFLTKAILLFEGGFVQVYSVFEVKTLTTRYYVQVLAPDGEARGKAAQLDIGDHFFEDTSSIDSGRFVVLGGPNQAKALQSARAIVVSVDAAGSVKQQVTPLAITAPVATRPAVAFAVSAKHWAMTVQVSPGQASQPIVIGGQKFRTIPIAGLPTGGGGAGGTESLIVDGVLRPIRGQGAGTSYALLSSLDRYQLAWSGDELAARWVSSGGDSAKPAMHHARLGLDGQLHPEAAGQPDQALRKSFVDEIETTFSSGMGGTVIKRLDALGEPVGEDMPLNGAVPDVGADFVNLDVAWGGDRFVIAYEPKVAGTTHLRSVGMRCDGR